MTKQPSPTPLECGYFAQCVEDAGHDGPHHADMYPDWSVPTIEPPTFIGQALADSATGPLPPDAALWEAADALSEALLPYGTQGRYHTEFEPVAALRRALKAATRAATGPLHVERNARIIAEYWRDEMMAGGSPLNMCAHPLAMVLTALDGETDPVQMGIPPEEFQRRLASQSSGDTDE